MARGIATTKDLHVVQLKSVRDARGELSILELAGAVPFGVARIFYIRDVPANTVRGVHAHRQCSQFFVCQSGRILVNVRDGKDERDVVMTAGNAILIQPGLFCRETFLEPASQLLVLCDRKYERADYIESWDEFVAFRATQGESRADRR